MSPLHSRRHSPRLNLERLESRQLLAVGDPLLPDFIAWADQAQQFIHGWSIDTRQIPNHVLLRLSTATPNIGRGPIELQGGDILPGGTEQEVNQRIYLEGGGFTERLAGTFIHHPTHGHIHFEGFAEYSLRTVLPGDGVGDVVATGGKTSFCLLDVVPYNTSLPGAPPASQYGADCDEFQGISVGWSDVYDRSLPDQWIDITGLPPTRYWLEVTVDPDDHLLELDETNNSTRILIDLGTVSPPVLPPQIIAVRVDRVADGHAPYVVPVGSGDQLLPVIAAGIDRISIDFSEQVTVARNQLSVVGENGSYAFAAGSAGFSAGPGPTPGTWRATWGFATPIFADQLTLTLADTIADTGQIVLDGEWNNPATTDPGAPGSVYPSGNRTPGGQFQFRLNVLAGDANRDLSVDRQDVAAIAAAFGRTTGANWAAGDFDGDGLVGARDLALLQSQLGDSLAVPSPSAAVSRERSNRTTHIAEPRRIAAKRARELAHDAALLEETNTVPPKPARSLRTIATRRAIIHEWPATL